MAHPPAPTPFYSILGKATWSQAAQNRLPDASFLLIEPGGALDDTKRTTPRSLRHLPVYDADGHLDLPHLRNAIAQIPKAGPWLSDAARTKLQDKARRMLERALETTHKAAADVPDWALGYLAHADTHQALGLDSATVAKGWRGDAMLGKRAADWASTYKVKPVRAARLPMAVEKALRTRVVDHNARAEAPHQRAKLGVLKAVYTRATDAHAAAGRPTVKSAPQWGMARVSAYLRLLASGAAHHPAYVADNDLLPAGHPRSPTPARADAAPTATPPAPPTTVVEQKDDMTTGDLAEGGLLAPEQGLPRRSVHGIPIVIDRPKGHVQTGVAKDGSAWERTYQNDYGYIPSTLGGDGDELDVFLGPDLTATAAYWVSQVKPDGGFDEYKVFLGFDSPDAARACYLAHIPEQFMGRMFETDVGALQSLLGMTPTALESATSGDDAAAAMDGALDAALAVDPAQALEQLRAVLDSIQAARMPVVMAEFPDDEEEPVEKDVHRDGQGQFAGGGGGGGGGGAHAHISTMSHVSHAGDRAGASPHHQQVHWAADKAKSAGQPVYATHDAKAHLMGGTKLAWHPPKKGDYHAVHPDGSITHHSAAKKAVDVEKALPGLPVRARFLRACHALEALALRCEDITEHQANRDAAVHDIWPAALELLAALGDCMDDPAEACRELGLDTSKPNGGAYGDGGYTGKETAPATPAESTLAKAFITIGKAASDTEEERYVLGPVLIPDRVDLQGDVYDEATVRDTAHRWMTTYQNTTVQHAENPEDTIGFRDDGAAFATDSIVPLESYLLPADTTFGSVTLPKGTWMLAARFVDDALWAKVKAGRITGWSIGGLGKRTPIAPPAAASSQLAA